MTTIADAIATLDSWAGTQPAAVQALVKQLDGIINPPVVVAPPAAPASSLFPSYAPAALQAYKPFLVETWDKIDLARWKNVLWYGDGHNDYAVNYVDASLATVANNRLLLTARVVPNMQDPKYEKMPYMGACVNSGNIKASMPKGPFALWHKVQMSAKPYEWSSCVVQEWTGDGTSGWEIDYYETNTHNGQWIANACHNKTTGADLEYGFNPTHVKGLENFKLTDDNEVMFSIDADRCYVWINGILANSFPNPGIKWPMFWYAMNGVGGWENPVHTMKPFPYPGSGTMSVGPLTIGVPA